MASPHPIPLEIGAIFGRWTILRELEPKPRPRKGVIRFAECQCVCGRTKQVQVSHLRSGASAGCRYCALAKPDARNGDKNRTYRIWVAMRNRCTYPSTYAWKWYGAKGIRVCDRWNEDYGNFLADMGEAPAGMSIDRKDSNLDYTPENCRWATQKEQMNNTSRNVFVEFQGEKMTVAQLSEVTGLKYKALQYRIKTKCMSAQDAVDEILAGHDPSVPSESATVLPVGRRT